MKKFKKVYIEITNICNLSCNFCPKTERKLKFMDEKSFEHIVKSVKLYTDHIYFHLMGEPLLHSNLGRFLEISHDNRLKVNITTNGTLISSVKDILISSPILRQVNISLSSFEANDKAEDLNGYIDNIVDFILEANEKSNIICSIRLWNMDSALLKGSNKANKDILNMLETKLKLDFKLSEKLRESHSVKLRNNVYLNMAEKFEWPDINKINTDDKVFCYGLRDQMGILVDGTVVPCCLDSESNIPLGNIFETSMDKILNSERAKNLYDGFSRRRAVEELCKRCAYVKRYS
ncbi:radical SAM/SPASM domain-containing protein [Clostridium thailandense]|uniref:radical SAM/SPASM domain-containing protein n=1 Tax=Clostridium thailandense TaxID=2794346 RepID=UPI003989CBB8